MDPKAAADTSKQRPTGASASALRKAVAASPAFPALERARLSARLADDKKAEDIVILDLRDFEYITEFFVIATGGNERQRHAIIHDIREKMYELGERPLGVAGERTSNWVLIDYGDLVVHVFDPDARKLYDLELLWGDAPRIDWQPGPAAGAGGANSGVPT